MSSFSKRQGLVPEIEIQIDSMDEALRNSLWNALRIFFWSQRDVPYSLSVVGRGGDFFAQSSLTKVLERLWVQHFRWMLDSMPRRYSDVLRHLKQEFSTLKWNEVYDFVEFMAPLADQVRTGSTSKFIEKCNEFLEKENSAWRFVGVEVARITDKLEIDEVKAAIVSPHEGIRTQFKSALTKYADRVNPDYRNSIKESISAVETVVNLINGTDGKSLGDALKKIGDAIDLHPALAKGFGSIYGYTCDDKSGIRHAMMEKTDINASDARFMLVSCSAFVNYLIAKAEQANIPLGS